MNQRTGKMSINTALIWKYADSAWKNQQAVRRSGTSRQIRQADADWAIIIWNLGEIIEMGEGE